MSASEVRLSNRDSRLLEAILVGLSDMNIRFAEVRQLLLNMGFYETFEATNIFSTDLG